MRKFFGIAALIGLSTILFFGCQETGQKPQKYTNEQIEGFAKQILSGPNAPTRSSFDGEDVQIEASRDVLTIGSPNAGKGDTLYDAANKIQNNFLTLFDAVYTNFVNQPTTNITVSGFTPSNYSSSGSSLNQHLTGIDTALGVTTDLSVASRTTTNFTLVSSDGEDVAIPEATTLLAGLLTSTDKTRLDALHAAGVNTDDQTASEVSVAFSPSNYSAGSANVEAHLTGIDSAINGLLVDGNNFEFVVSETPLSNGQNYNVSVNTLAATSNIVITLPSNPSNDQTVHIVDRGGRASIYNILTGSDVRVSSDYGAATLQYKGGAWQEIWSSRKSTQTFEKRFGNYDVTYFKRTGSVTSENLRDLPFHGFGQAYTSVAGMKYNAISVPKIVRSLSATEKWQYIIAEVRMFNEDESFSTAGALTTTAPTLVATGRAAVDPDSSVLTDVFIQLFSPLGGTITINNTLIPEGSKYFIGYYAVNEKGTAALGDVSVNDTDTNAEAQSYYYSSGALTTYNTTSNCVVDQLYVKQFDASGAIRHGSLTSRQFYVPMLVGRASAKFFLRSAFGPGWDAFREYGGGGAGDQIYQDRIDLTGSSAGLQSKAYMFFDDRHTPIGLGYENFNLVATNTNSGSKSIITIGDSITAAQTYQAAMNTAASATGDTLTFIGTQGTGSTLNEGRSGWTVDNFWDPGASFYSANPFTQNNGDTFDFSFYLTDTGLAQPEAVTIMLGTNDLFGMYSDTDVYAACKTKMQYIENMIDSIHAVSSLIRVFVVTIPPGGEWGSFPYITSNPQTPERWQRNVLIWNAELFRKFSHRSADKIYVAPVHYAMDRANHFADGVHPNADGYAAIGEALLASLKINW